MIESYLISNFIDDTYLLRFEIGDEVKAFAAIHNTQIQYNKITEDTVEKAASEMMKYFDAEKIEFDIDNMVHINLEVFSGQEKRYDDINAYRLLSLLSVALIDLGIIEMN